MSWSLQISNGDLSLGGSGMNTVTGGSKLVQDLTCCVLEPMGTDDMHPDFGSIIDGGTPPGQSFQQGVIGHQNNQEAAQFVSAEIQRITTQYQQRQASRNAADVASYSKSTLSAGEALIAVQDVTIAQSETAMLVTATLQTGAGTSSINIPVVAS